MTKVVTKQLQPIYDKPMIYYPMSLLMMMGINEILIITTPHDNPHFLRLLGDGERFGIKITYAIQDEPKGIAQAYEIASDFLESEDSMMVLGDNLFHGDFDEFRQAVEKQLSRKSGAHAHIFAYPVHDPERYGVVEFDKVTNQVISIEEKPEAPKSHYAIPGVYLFDGTAKERVASQKPSKRGELEITDLIQTYLDEGKLNVQVISRGMAWLDTGTPESLLDANSYIATLEQRQGLKVACLEEIALRMKFYDLNAFNKVIEDTPNSPYRDYLETIAKENR
jgi:glucose-1-phosphate thymidylyltransferase